MTSEFPHNPENFGSSSISELEYLERDLSNLPGNENHHSLNVSDKSGNRIGFIDISFYPDTGKAVIATVEVERHLRNQGYGKAMYKHAIELAKQDDLRLESSSHLSSEGEGVWKSLCAEGLAYEENGKYYAK